MLKTISAKFEILAIFYLLDSIMMNAPKSEHVMTSTSDVIRTANVVITGWTAGRRCCFIAELSGRFSSFFRCRSELLLSDILVLASYGLDLVQLNVTHCYICTLILGKH